jgi:hypothetical protein
MSNFVYLLENQKHHQLERLIKIGLFFKNNEDILFDKRTLYPRLKDSSKRGIKAMMEIFDTVKDQFNLKDFNDYIKVARRNEMVCMDNHIQIADVSNLKKILIDYENKVYIGSRPFVPKIKVEEAIEDRLEIIKDIIRDEKYETKELKQLLEYIVKLI